MRIVDTSTSRRVNEPGVRRSAVTQTFVQDVFKARRAVPVVNPTFVPVRRSAAHQTNEDIDRALRA